VIRYLSGVPETYLAIDLGAQRLAAGVVDSNGTVVIRDRVSAPLRQAWPVLARLISRVLAATPPEQLPTRCGVSCVGPIDHGTGQIMPAHLPVWHGFDLGAHLLDELGMPVAVRSSGQGFALAETWCGAATGKTDLLAILMSDVVEAGVISSGRLLHGLGGNVGSIAHMVVEPDGKLCSCGVHGCVDTYVGMRALEEETKRALERTPAALIDRAGIMLGRAVASLIAITDPELVLVGGRGIYYLGQRFEVALQQEIAERSRRRGDQSLTVQVLGPEATSPLIRAAAVARSAATKE
jgi:glucokinase